MRNSGVDVPEWLANIKSVSKKERQKLKRRPVQRKSISEAASEGYAAPPPGTQKRKRKQGSKGSVQRALAWVLSLLLPRVYLQLKNEFFRDIEDDEMHDEDA